ncbi:hypothetical protein OSB04_025472 [Centaurea solstitialis]|uniref:Polyprotein n=1 Tax=Centaurea solstitialis TaxID=347529 RepID=A0AA38WBB9_9ASTR|nr:hypothetical protein OSB04_025472 [Centaurea solstitialis]
MSFSVIPFYTPEESLRLINGKWKLTGQNFPVWKMHLDNILRAQGKFYVLEKPVSRPKSNSPEEEFTQYFKYMADESDVMSILIFSISSEFTDRLRDKSCHEVVKDIESQLGFYKHTGKLLIMKEILSLKLKKDKSVKDHLMEIRRLFKCLTRLGYKLTQEELMYLMWYSLLKEICDTASAYMKEPKTDGAALHENILASLEPKPAPADLMDTDWIDELGDLSCPKCGSKDICEHSMNIDQIEIGLSDAPGIFMIDCLITSYESWVIDTGSGNHICNHLQGFTRRKTLRKDRSNLRVGEGTPLIAEAVGSYSLSLPSGLVLELDNCYYIPNMIKYVLSFDLLVDQGRTSTVVAVAAVVVATNIVPPCEVAASVSVGKTAPRLATAAAVRDDRSPANAGVQRATGGDGVAIAAMTSTVTSTNNLSLRSILEKDKLTGSNFLDWERNLMIVLRHERKWYVLEEPLGEAPPANAPAAARNAHKKHSDDLLDVACLMLATMSPDLQAGLINTNAYDMIRQLRDMFQTQARTERYDATKAFNECKMVRGTSVSDHVMKMKRHLDHLERLGHPVPLQLATDTILNSLSEDYRPFVVNYNMNNMEKTIAELHSMLKTAELNMGNKNKTKDVLMVKDGGVKKKNGHASTSKGKGPVQAIQSAPKKGKGKGKGKKVKPNKARTENRCFICNEIGHWRQNCPKRHEAGSYDQLLNNSYKCCRLKVAQIFDRVPNIGRDPWLRLLLGNSHNWIQGYPQKPNKTYLWHCRLGHINKKRVELLLKGGFLGTFDYKPFDNCESCLSGKMTKQPFNKENERATDLLEIIHTDVCGPFSHVAKGGYRYFITFTDDFSRYGYVYLMRHKSESFERFREFQNEVQNQLGRKIKFLRSDRGGEYLSDEFDNHLMECGIVSQLTPPYTPQMNGVSERRNRTLLHMVRSMMYHSTLPMSFWGHAFETAAHILNRAPTKSVEKTPYELWKGKKPNISFLRILGCEVYVKRPTSEKLKPKSDKCFFVGYPRTTVGYYFYNPEENKVFVARNGKFLEEKFLSYGNTRKDVDLQVVDEENTTPIVEPEIQHENVEPQSESIEEVKTQDLRRSSRVRQEPDRYLGFLVSQDSGDLNEPTSYGEAVSGNESEQWQEAMKAEMQSMYDNQVWELTDLPQHCRAVGRKWVFKKKTDMDGNVHTFKARLVAKGFTQTHGIDYDETFSPVAMLKSIRILMAISAYFNYEIWQMDVKTAFLNGKLTEDVYMEQPEGFEDPKNPNKVCKLLKSIYGLKQASRSWNLHFDERIKEFGFAKSEFEPCVYTKFSGSIVTFLVLYVDDILLIGNDVPTLQSVKSWLSKCFQMKDLGEAAYILGIKIYRNRSKRLIRLSQSTYIDKILKKFRMDESKKGFIPMQHGIVLSKTQCPVSSQDQDKMKSVPYASAIGSIMYAMLCTRPDVAYSVSVTSRYQQNPGEPHWVAVKNILKYLRRTKDMFLVFGGSEDEISVNGYSDASFQTDRDDFRSQSGYVFTLNRGAISWKSSKQDTIADSTTEAEYIAASDAATEAVWLRNFLSDLRVVASVSRPIDIFCDNSGAVAQAKEPREHHKSRHVLRKYHLIREIIGRGDVRICKIPTEENVADPLTKPLARVKHEAHANSIGMQYLDASS